MLKSNSVRLAHNLARIAKDRNITIAAVNGTLMSELTSTVVNRWQIKAASQGGNDMPVAANDEDNIVYALVAAGQTDYKPTGKTYQSSEHDTVMDNYTADLARLISQHIVYARSVVYKEMTHFVDKLSENARNTSIPIAEDLFSVHFVAKHPIFDSYFIQDEVNVFANAQPIGQCSFTVANALLEANVDFAEKFSTESASDNEVIRAWVASVGQHRLQGFLQMTSTEASYKLKVHELPDYHLFNFLLNRLLVNDSSMAVTCKSTMSLAQFVTEASLARDHHAQQLFHALRSVQVMRDLKYVVIPGSVSYSYLSKDPVDVYILEENFQLAAEQGVTLEHVFAYIAKGDASQNLDVDTLVNNMHTLSQAWQTQRSLYAAYLTQNKSERLRSEMRQALYEILDSAEHVSSMQDFYGKDTQYKDKTVLECNKAIDAFTQSQLEDLKTCSFALFAVIVHRHSNAKEIISKMFDLMTADASMDSAQAVSVSVVLYLTDYLLAQLQIR